MSTLAVRSILLCGTMLLASRIPLAGADAAAPLVENVPIAGGVAALANAVLVSPVPDRPRFIAELVRVVYSSPEVGPYSNEPTRRRIAGFFASARLASQSGASISAEDIPVPLSAAVWSQAIFHRPVEPSDLVGAILANRSAALICYGLAALDDDTLKFFADRPSMLGRLAERGPAAFAAFGESLRVRGGRLVMPGGDLAALSWEAVVGERLARPDRFVEKLFESDRGRLAYLYDVLAHLDAPSVAFVLGSETSGADERTRRFKRLAGVADRAFPMWDVTAAPFVRPTNDLAAFFARVSVASIVADDPRSSPAIFAPRAFWQRVFGDRGPVEPPAKTTGASTDTSTDAAWFAEVVLMHPAAERERRLDALAFAGRVFASRPPAEWDEAADAARSFGSFPALMLTLERMGVTTPSVYLAAAEQAGRLTGLDEARGRTALAQFQGALALVARLVRVRTIDATTAEGLVRELVAVRVTDTGRYEGGIAAWIGEHLEKVLPVATGLDDRLLAAAAGPAATRAAPRVLWEGQTYHVDIGGAERQRLERVRERQERPPVDTTLSLASIAGQLRRPDATIETARDASKALGDVVSRLTAGSPSTAEAAIRTMKDAARDLGALTRTNDLAEARRLGAQLAAAADAMLGEALLSLAYAFDLGDPDGTALIAGDPSRYHDFGYGLPNHNARTKAMWRVATAETHGGPWHLVGSALGLDVAMAPLALRRISTDRLPETPMLNLLQRDGFATAVALMNPWALSDADRDRAADQIERGRRRVDQLRAERVSADQIANEIALDGWRRRALDWTLRHDPERTAALFSATELLVLGGGRPAEFDSWGTDALATAGCLCTRLEPPGAWRHWWGLPQTGLPAILVADLPLRVAVVLHNLRLPAALARSVLAAAMQDFIDNVNPIDGNDWLTLARAAQAIGQERFEDYVAAATADGPLLPDSP